jgi:hypothetical protein
MSFEIVISDELIDSVELALSTVSFVMNAEMVKIPVVKEYPSVKVVGIDGRFSFDLETIDETIQRPAVVFLKSVSFTHGDLYQFAYIPIGSPSGSILLGYRPGPDFVAAYDCAYQLEKGQPCQAIFDVNDSIILGFTPTTQSIVKSLVLSRFSVNGLNDSLSTAHCRAVMVAYSDMLKSRVPKKGGTCSKYRLKGNTGICSAEKSVMVTKLVSDTEILKPLETCVHACNGGKFSDLPRCLYKTGCASLFNEWDSCRSCIASEDIDPGRCFRDCDNVKKLYRCVEGGECLVSSDGYPVENCMSTCGEGADKKYGCDGGVCTEVVNGSGVALSECLQNCKGSAMAFKCDQESFQCRYDPAGEYPELHVCQAKCKNPDLLFSPSLGCLLSADGVGYATKSECAASLTKTVPWLVVLLLGSLVLLGLLVGLVLIFRRKKKGVQKNE